MSDRGKDFQDEFLDPEDRDFVIDDDLAELSRYLGGDMTEEERRNVEARARTDGDFWRKIGPLVGLFALDMPVDVNAFREAFDVHRDDVPVAITEGLREGRPGASPAHTPTPGTSSAQVPVHLEPPPPAPVLAPPYSDPRLPAYVPVPSYGGPRAPESLPVLSRVDVAGLVVRDAVGGTAKVVMYGIAAVLFVVLGLEVQPVRSLATRALANVLVHTDTADLNRTVRDAKHDLPLGFLPVDGQGPMTEDAGAPDGPKMYVFDDRSRGVVLPGSRIAFRTPTTTFGRGMQRGLLRGRPGHYAVIDGEVVFTAVARWVLQTMTARIEIDSGMVAIRRLPHGTVTQVNVGQGMVWVFPSHTLDSIAVHTGEVLMIPSTGSPRLGRDTTGFPLFGDTAHPTNPGRTP